LRRYLSSASLALLCVLLLRPAAHAQFETRGSFAADQYPQAIAVGDFNHDGKADLAVVSGCCFQGVVILLGNGDGTFRRPVSYAAGVAPVSVVAADFNHDGNLDLAVANSLSTYVSILLGNGDGTFQPATQTPPLSDPIFVAAGDFNGDGIPDLVTVLSGSVGGVAVLLGNGDGTFRTAITTQPSFVVATIGVGDFNGDGKLDLVTSGEFGATATVNVLLGNGDGTFKEGESYVGDSSPASIAVADFNGDHKLDFAVANFEGVGIEVWLGNGDGSFLPGVNYETSFPIWVAAAQLTGNGKIDLAVANHTGGVSVLLGKGDGTFQPAAFYPEGREDRFVAVGDFNGDKKPDLVLANGGLNYVSVLLNTGVVSLSPTTPLNFKKQAVGTTSPPQTVRLTNTGSKALRIASMKASAEFGVTSTCGASVAAGAKCTISVTFSPTQKGAKQGTITIIDSASTQPQVIELLGTGT